MNAVSEPICMCAALDPVRPRTTARPTVEALKMIMTIGKTSACSRPTLRAVLVRVALATANALGLEVLAHEGADHADAGDLLAHDPVHAVDRGLHEPELRNHLPDDEADGDRQQRDRDGDDARQRPTSSRNAMKMPPTMLIGAETMHRQRHEHDHLHLGHVVGVAGDQRRRAELGDLLRGEVADAVEDRRRAGRGPAPSTTRAAR